MLCVVYLLFSKSLSLSSPFWLSASLTASSTILAAARLWRLIFHIWGIKFFSTERENGGNILRIEDAMKTSFE